MTSVDNMKANIRPEEINLFINTPYSVSPFAWARKKPRNYRERLSYVNLETKSLSLRITHRAYRNYLNIFAPGESLDPLSDLTFILFITKIFTSHHQGLDNWALMHRFLSRFATRKPPIWCQKNEN